MALTAVLAGVAAIACGVAVGCKKSHRHEFSNEWSASPTEHWHAAICGDTDEKGSLGKHTFDSAYHCDTCGYDLELAGIKVTKTRTEYEFVHGRIQIDFVVILRVRTRILQGRAESGA